MNQNTAQEAINALYGKSCEVLEFELNKSRGVYTCIAILDDDPEIKFQTEFDRNTSEIIRSNYPQLRWRQDYKVFSEEVLREDYEPFVHDVSFYSKLETTIDYKQVPDFDEITINLESSNKTEIRIYFFQEREENFWEGIRAFIQKHKDLNFESSSFQFNFYNADFFSDKDLDAFNYGFKSSGSKFFETKYFEHLESRLLFTLKYEDEIPSAEQLEEALDTNPNQFIIRPHKF